MTVRNGLPFIKDAISSVLGQEGVCLELIVVDDGSSDGTSDFLKSLSGLANVTVILREAIGRPMALNLAVSKTQFDYVCNLDADDILHPRHAASCLSKLLENDSDVVCSVPDIFSSGLPALAPVEAPSTFVNVSKTLVFQNPVCHSGAIIKKAAFFRVGGYDQTRVTQLDYDLWFRIVASGGAIARANEPLVGKRIHKGQSFENKKRIAYVKNSLLLQWRIIQHQGGGVAAYAVLFARAVYSLVPQRLRAWLRK